MNTLNKPLKFKTIQALQGNGINSIQILTAECTVPAAHNNIIHMLQT